MNYSDGQAIKPGDRIKIGDDLTGLVVACMETQQYSPEFPKSEWEYLKHGFLVESSKYGLVHYPAPDEDLKLIERKAAPAM
jgi:hypothetical protein